MIRAGLAVSAASDIGLQRPSNEDSHAVWIPEKASERRRRGVLLIVADGMGGTAGGEIASQLAVETVVRLYREGGGETIANDLKRAIEEANRAVHTMSRSRSELNGMGTTCTAVVIRDDHATIAHVGDSRAYLLRDGSIQQLTRDHSLVAQLVERRQMSEEQARRDPRRNVMTRCVGATESVEVDTFEVTGRLRPGDSLLVCSDGLHGQVSAEELAAAADQSDTVGACSDLIAMVNDRGGPDNITVVVARVQTPVGFWSARFGNWVRACLIIGLLGLTLSLSFMLWLANRIPGD